MSDTELLKSIQKDISEIKRIQKQILSYLERPRACWVNAQTIMELTGWDGNAMYRARQNKTVGFKKTTDGGYLYDLNTLNPLLLKKDISKE